jgi:hypothetical protein
MKRNTIWLIGIFAACILFFGGNFVVLSYRFDSFHIFEILDGRRYPSQLADLSDLGFASRYSYIAAWMIHRVVAVIWGALAFFQIATMSRLGKNRRFSPRLHKTIGWTVAASAMICSASGVIMLPAIKLTDYTFTATLVVITALYTAAVLVGFWRSLRNRGPGFVAAHRKAAVRLAGPPAASISQHLGYVALLSAHVPNLVAWRVSVLAGGVLGLVVCEYLAGSGIGHSLFRRGLAGTTKDANVEAS